MNVKDGKDTTEFKMAVGSIVSLIMLFLVATGAITSSQQEVLHPVFFAAITALIAGVPIVIGWVTTTYTNSRRDVKTSANTAHDA